MLESVVILIFVSLCLVAFVFLVKYVSDKNAAARRELEIKNAGVLQMEIIACQAAYSGKDSSTLPMELSTFAQQANLDTQHCKDAMMKGFDMALDRMLESGATSEEMIKKTENFLSGINMTEAEFGNTKSNWKFYKTLTLRELMDGKIPNWFKPLGIVNVNLQKNESIVWAFPDVNFLEEKTYRQYAGGYQGVSIRIAKGLYYRTGGFRGEPMDTTKWVHMDTGVLVITNKHLYFVGCKKSFRHPFSKIINLIPFDEGIGVFTDGQRTKPKAFMFDDGLFVYNLIKNLSQI